MRVLIFSDLHGHAFKSYSSPDPVTGLNSRLVDAVYILDEIYQVCSKYEVDVVLFGGDLYHIRTPITVSTFNIIHEAIARIKTVVSHVGLLVGNHDQSNKSGDIHSIDTYKAIVDVFDQPKWYQYNGLSILAIPYSDDKISLVNSIHYGVNSAPAGKKILLGHFDLSGAKVGSNFVRITPDCPNILDLKEDKFNQIFLGHYHIPQILTENVRFIGATHHHNWGDAGQDRGFWLWDTEEDEFSEPTLVQLTSAPRFISVYHKDLAKIPPKEITNNIIRIVYESMPTKEQWEMVLASSAQFKPRWIDYIVEPRNKSKVISSQSSYHPGMDYEEMVTKYAKENCDKLNPDILAQLGHELLQAARGEQT